MKSIIKVLVMITVLTAAIIYGVTAVDAQDISATIPDSAEYPVLLVHGLGGGPGEATFGMLEEYLEAFYFNVEVMDFDETKIANLNDHKNGDNLAVLAAVLGRKVKEMLKQYDVDKVNVVAHSYGGLIVQAYILDRGASMNKKFGTFEFDIDKVLYLATPFYGVDTSNEVVEDLVNDTNYGVYSRPAQMLTDLKVGSQTLFDMDATLRSYNPYAFDVEVATIVSDEDDIMDPRSGTLGQFTGKFYPFKRYRIMRGFKHAFHPSSGGNDKKRQSLAYVDRATDNSFVSIVSFLDDGLSWRKIPAAMEKTGMVMVAHNGKNLSGDEVSLKNKKGDDIEPVFNENSGVFSFWGLSDGNYTLTVTSGGKTTTETVTVISEGDEMSIPAFAYNFRKNDLSVGDGTSGKLNGIYTLEELKYTSLNREHKAASVKGLDPNGFEITCFIEGGDVDLFDKGRVFVLYNANGSQAESWNKNGGRIEVQVRGNYNQVDDHRHAGKIGILACIDDNRNGVLEHGFVEDYEEKSHQTFNWEKIHRIRVVVEYIKQRDETLISLYLDSELISSFDLKGQYYNPNPLISFGGKRFDHDYFSPKGLTITNFVIRNLDD